MTHFKKSRHRAVGDLLKPAMVPGEENRDG